VTRDDSLKVFISWSGGSSRDVALALRKWLRDLSDRVDSWVSDVDIDSGARSMDELNSELDGTHFGIIVVTQENQHAPWLNFEAGALSKQVGGSKSRVIPLLMDMQSPTELTGPLSQYQAVLFEKPGLTKLLTSIAAQAGVDQSTMESRLEKYWPDLVTEVAQIRSRHAERALAPSRRSERDLAEETLERIRSIERLLEVSSSTTPSTASYGLDHRLAADPDKRVIRERLTRLGATDTRNMGPSTLAVALPDDWSPEQEAEARAILSQAPGLRVEWMSGREFLNRLRP
jgi:hypothetical protein